MPVWTMFQVPRAGGEYSRLAGKGSGNWASPILSQAGGVFPEIFFSIACHTFGKISKFLAKARLLAAEAASGHRVLWSG